MSSKNGNTRKDELLGEPHGTAAGRLRKHLLFKYVTLAGHAICHRCSGPIETAEDLSVEHTTPWQSADDPRAVFFDLDTIAFSHLRCNCDAGDRSRFVSANTGKTHCLKGHPFDAANTRVRKSALPGSGTFRECIACNRERLRRTSAERLR